MPQKNLKNGNNYVLLSIYFRIVKLQKKFIQAWILNDELRMHCMIPCYHVWGLVAKLTSHMENLTYEVSG